MTKYVVFLFIMTLIVGCRNTSNDKVYSISGDGIVPDKSTAIKIANAILPNFYGNKVLHETPFVCGLIGDTVWVIDGTKIGEGKGGAAHLEIRKRDGAVLNVWHGK